jgi:2-polyprenyl-3-methyl-5-hydroxy-6-metoxy-1,4-benzoquinol methylase
MYRETEDPDLKTKKVQSTLAKSDVHDEWVTNYRTPENEPFFELAFDYIEKGLNPPQNSTILDAGCGTCNHSIRLAKRGFRCTAVDFSEKILKKARLNVEKRGLETRITIKREDVTSLSFKDETFDYILCWGVLMHIPNLEKALSELSRVLKLNGAIIISESNVYSIQSLALQKIIKHLLRRKRPIVEYTFAGMEYWINTTAGPLFVRQSNVGHLIFLFKKNGLVARSCVAGQFTELYTTISNRTLRHVVHAWNNMWFKYIKLPYPAFGNIIIADKISSSDQDNNVKF